MKNPSSGVIERAFFTNKILTHRTTTQKQSMRNTVSVHNPGGFGYTGGSNRIGYGKIRRPTFSARNKSGLTGRAKGRCTQVHFGRRPFWRKKHQHKKCRSQIFFRYCSTLPKLLPNHVPWDQVST